MNDITFYGIISSNIYKEFALKHIFIVNPAAGIGTTSKVKIPDIIQFLKSAGLDYEIHRTLNKQEVGTWTKERAMVGDPVRFYAVGGDGTICDVANGIIGCKNAELAVMPCGTGNDFVKNFTNRRNFLDLSKQVKGIAVPIDVIKYNDDYCVNMLNIGADCDVVVKSDELKDAGKASGAVSYALAALDVLPKNPRYRMSYKVDGVEYEEDLMLVAVANGKFCGGGFKSCPKASLVDGLMDIGIVKPCSGAKLLQMLAKYRFGTHLEDKEAYKYVKYLQLKEFDLKPINPCIVSVDGEVYDFKPTHFSVVKEGINIVVPDGSQFIV